MERNTYGYVRVSTQVQNEARQLSAMREFGVEDENIIIEKQSGRDFKRPLYQQLVGGLRAGDVLVVKSIDRLGRNYTEILEQWAFITKKQDAAIVVLDMPLLDTRQGRDLTGTLISDIVLQLLSYVAQTERENIRQRQAEGIAAAKEQGVRFGRERLELPESFPEFAQLWQNGRISSRCAAEELGMSYKTFQRNRYGGPVPVPRGSGYSDCHAGEQRFASNALPSAQECAERMERFLTTLLHADGWEKAAKSS